MSFDFYLHAGVAVIAAWFGWRRLDTGVLLPWTIFVVAYFLTTVIGAIIIGMPDGLDFLQLFNPSVDVRFVQDAVNAKYWFLLFLPITLITLLLLFTRRLILPWEKTISNWFQRENINWAYFIATVILTILLTLYSLMVLATKDYLGNIRLAFSGELDFQATILLRHQMMDAMTGRGIYYYEIAYVSFPTMSWIALYRALQSGSNKWRMLFCFQFMIIVFLLLSSMQKAPLLIYLIGVLIALAYMGKLKVYRLAMLGVLGLSLLTFMQSYYVDDWTVLMSVFHSVFRLSSSFIYYVAVYPQHEAYQPVNYGLGLLGVGVSMRDNLVVFDYMYPDVFWTQGAAAGASHLRAYSQGGIIWASLATIIVWLLIRLLGRLRKSLSGPVGFALLVQSGVTLYYLTQTSLRGAALESYGLLWGVIPLVALVVLSSILRNAVAPKTSRLRNFIANGL
jgi:hypothetical protein